MNLPDEKYDIHPEIAKAMPPQPVEEPQEEPEQEAPIQEQPKPQETEQQMRFKILRERAERAERERDEALRLAQQSSKPYQQEEPSNEEFDIQIGNDDIAEGKHLKKVYEKVKKLESELSRSRQQYSAVSAEQKLKAQFTDFDKVVTEENIKILAQMHPPAGNTLRNTTDLYDAGYMAYTLIKQFHIDAPHITDVERAQKNAAKPKPLNSISPQQGDTPLSRANAFANGLSEDLKAQLLKEMNEARKGY